MAMQQIGAINVSQTSYKRAREIVENKPQGVKKSADEVLESLRKMMPGWTISTTSADWTAGVRNIEIDRDVLERMAEDPEAMVRIKALILDLEEAVPVLEEWKRENKGQSLTFGFDLAANGQVQAIALLRTLWGEEVRTTFDLPAERNTWSAIIQDKLNALSQGQVENVEGQRSWLA